MAKATKAKKEITPKIEKPKIREVKRKIYYYELNFIFNDNIDFGNSAVKEAFYSFFSIIAKMAENKEAIRYQTMNNAKIFVQDVKFTPDGKYIEGKLRHVQMDVFPEILDIEEDTTRDIVVLESEGIVQTTHFIIDISKETKYLVLEYNHAGAKFSDFILYCERIGKAKKVLEEITKDNFKWVERDEISSFEKRMKAISSFIMRVHKNNLDKIQGLNKKLITSLKLVADQYSTEYIEIHLKFTVNKQKPVKKMQPIRKTVKDLLDSLTKNKEQIALFDTLKASAQDTEKGLNINVFDLLADRVSSDVSVQLRQNHDVIVSLDMFDKMKNEYVNKNI